MASTYSNLKFELIGTGDQSGTWGTTTNTNLGTAIEQALVGMATISSGFTGSPLTLTLTLTDTNAAQNARALVLNLTQALGSAGTLNVPAIQKPYMIINATGQTVTVKVSGLTGVAVPTGKRAFLYNNGTDVGSFFNYADTLSLGTDLAVADGGTGASCASTARTNLGLGTISTQAANNVSITGGSITGITDLAVADGGTGASTACGARTNLGLGTISTQAANNVSITGGSITGITDLAVADGGTGASTACGARTNLGLGTISTQAANNVSITGGSITGITDLAVADGGTGASSAPAARTNLGASTVGSNFFTLTNPSAITFIRINADNTVSALSAADFRTAIGAGTGGGSVTCVATSGSINGLTLTGGPITSTGTVTLGGGVNVSTITTGTLPVARGGTGLCTVGTSGNVLTSNGTAWVSQAVAAGGANVQSFTATGTYTKPPGTKFVMVEIWGAGGGGGGAAFSPCFGVNSGAGGGGGGAYSYRLLNAPQVGATETVTIGAGGSAGAATGYPPLSPVRAGNGGTTNFGTLVYAYGGGGGSGLNPSNPLNAGYGGGGVGGFNGVAILNNPLAPYSRTLITGSANLPTSSPFCYAGVGLWAGGSGGCGQLDTPIGKTAGYMSMFGGGGGGGGSNGNGGGTPTVLYPNPSGTPGGLGRAFGAPPSRIQTPFNSPTPGSFVAGYVPATCMGRYKGGGGNAATPTCAAVAGSCFNGGGAGTVGPRGLGAAGGIAGGGGGGSVCAPNIYSMNGGAGGNGYAIIYSWS